MSKPQKKCVSVYVCVPLCETIYMQDVIENVDGQDMADRLSNAPLIKFTINKKDVTGMIALVSKCDCNERQFCFRLH